MEQLLAKVDDLEQNSRHKCLRFSNIAENLTIDNTATKKLEDTNSKVTKKAGVTLFKTNIHI